MRFLIIMVLFILTSCIREPEENLTTCYSYFNETERLITLEFYDYQNCGDFITEIGIYNKNGSGLIEQRCKMDDFVPGPVNLYRFDSIVVKFDHAKKLTYLFRCLQNPDSIYDGNFYELNQEGNNYNLIWRFTEDDYNNAQPF